MIDTSLNNYSPNPIGIVAANKSTTQYLSTAEGRRIYGGKGHSLMIMHELGLPVPPAIILPTSLSMSIGRLESADKQRQIIEELVTECIYPVYKQVFPHHDLVSVRSGAPVSMAGMMDTIMNVGLTKESMPVWQKRLNKWTAIDCLRRYLQMSGVSYFDIDSDAFEKQLNKILASKIGKGPRPKNERDMGLKYLIATVKAYTEIHRDRMFIPEFNSVETQLMMAIYAVFHSYQSERARYYRKLHNLDEEMGTAVCIQKMVFGNRNQNSCAGVVFSRDPFTGNQHLIVDFLPKAQGEDVVSGYREPMDANALYQWNPEILNQLAGVVDQLENYYKDMVDVEFTVDNGKLYILQCRVGRRSATAAFRIARDMSKSDMITHKEAVSRLSYDQYQALSGSILEKPPKEHLKGTAVCNGVSVALCVTTPEQAKQCKHPYILVREMTDANDIIAMSNSVGVLTQTGGATCHAAVVARAMNIPCIVGIPNLLDVPIPAEVQITMDGGSGKVWFDTEIKITENTKAPFELVDWLVESSTPSANQIERMYHTGASCWANEFNTICVDIQNLDTEEEFYAMLLDALTFPLAFVDPKILPIQQFEEEYKQALGIIDETEKLEDNRRVHFTSALQSIAADYETNNIMFLLDQHDDQNDAATFESLGFRTITVVHTLQDMVMSPGDLIASPMLYSNFGRDVVAKIVELKQAVVADFNLYSYPETRARRISNVLNSD